MTQASVPENCPAVTAAIRLRMQQLHGKIPPAGEEREDTFSLTIESQAKIVAILTEAERVLAGLDTKLGDLLTAIRR